MPGVISDMNVDRPRAWRDLRRDRISAPGRARQIAGAIESQLNAWRAFFPHFLTRFLTLFGSFDSFDSLNDTFK